MENPPNQDKATYLQEETMQTPQLQKHRSQYKNINMNIHENVPLSSEGNI